MVLGRYLLVGYLDPYGKEAALLTSQSSVFRLASEV